MDRMRISGTEPSSVILSQTCRNHLFSRKRKCEVDHPSQSTEVNLSKKQKLCCMLCFYRQYIIDVLVSEIEQRC